MAKVKNDVSVTTIQLTHEIMKMDGIDHIRIDNRANTDLGRILDSQYILPFIHPVLGQFNTTEGFWHYISMENPSDLLRVINGHECRKHIHDLKKAKKFKKIIVKNFYDHILFVNHLKIEASPKLKRMFIESTLPFKMYYVRKQKDKCVFHNTSSLHSRIQVWEKLRDMYKVNPYLKLDCPDCTTLSVMIKK